MRTTTARLLLLAFTLQSVAPTGAFAASRAVELPAVPMTAPAGLAPLSVVTTPQLPGAALPAPLAATLQAPVSAVPSAAAAPRAAEAASAAGAPAMQEAGAAMPRLQQAAAASSELAKPQASAGDLKAASARQFDAAPRASAAVDAAGAEAPPHPDLAAHVAVARLAASPKGRRAARIKQWAPMAMAAAGAVGAAVIAHVTGHHDLAVGALPLIGLGTVQENPAAKDQKLLAYIRANARPGQALRPSLLSEAAERLDYSQQGAYEALGRLGSMGHVMLLSNGHAILVDLSQEQPDAKSRDAARAAREAVQQINNDNVVAHLKALATLTGAYNAMQHALEHPQPAAAQQGLMAQLRVLTLNASLEVQRDAVLDFDDRLSAPGVPPGAKSEGRATAHAVNNYLYANVPDIYASMTRPSEEIHAALTTMLGKYNPTDGDAAAARGLSIARQMVAKIAPFKASASNEDAEDRGPGKRPLLTAPASSNGSAAHLGQPALKSGWRPLDPSKYEALGTYGTNVTKLAADGKLKPLIGRAKELKQVVKTLLRDEKNNPIVVGEAGVGKTALVEGLAQRIVNGDVPEELRGKQIIQLSITKLIAGTQYRGQFEERVQKILDEVRASNGQVILFIDEIHKILGAGGAKGATDLSQMLLENLGRGGISVLGATTLDKYRQIEKDGALNRRFNGVMLQPPTPAEAVEIVSALKGRYEKRHGVTIDEATIKAAVQMANRFVTDRFLPDSALDLLDDASSEVQIRAAEAKAKGQPEVREVTKDDIGVEIALRLDVPAANMTGDEREKLKKLPERLKARVIGQDEAVEAVSRAVRRTKLGYKDPNQPDMFVFVGPTGVGKTELVKALALEEFGSAAAMTRIDMSEYQEKHNVARLIGAPPGYVGYEEGGKLTEAVRRKPYQILLLDEIDKAHPDVWNLLLQIKEDGRLTDGNGRVIDFRNVIIVATANYKGQHSQDRGAKRNPIGFVTPSPEKASDGKSPDEKSARKAQYVEDFREAVRPETFGRIGDHNVVAFNELESEHYAQIAGLREADLNKRLAHKNMAIKLTENAVKQILLEADTPENRRYGARPLKQTVEDDVVEALVEADLDGRIGEGDSVTVDFDFGAKAWVVSKNQR